MTNGGTIPIDFMSVQRLLTWCRTLSKLISAILWKLVNDPFQIASRGSVQHWLGEQTNSFTCRRILHKKTKVGEEQRIGQWKRRFSILHSEVCLNLENVVDAVLSTPVLHNLAIELRMPEPEDEEVFEDEQPEEELYQGRQITGIQERNKIANGTRPLENHMRNNNSSNGVDSVSPASSSTSNHVNEQQQHNGVIESNTNNDAGSVPISNQNNSIHNQWTNRTAANPYGYMQMTQENNSEEIGNELNLYLGDGNFPDFPDTMSCNTLSTPYPAFDQLQ